MQRQAQAASAAAPVDAGLSLEKIRFRYAVSGSNPPWKPLRAFDGQMADKITQIMRESGTQFLIGKTAQPYELVVNDIKKDVIKGYVSAPKVRAGR